MSQSRIGIRNHYEKVYSRMSESDWLKASNVWARLCAIERLNLALGLLSGAHNQVRSILDLGCAEAFYYNFMKIGSECNYVAADLARINLLKAKRNGVPNFVQCDAEHLPFRDRAFDIVLFIEVLEHVVRPREALRQIFMVGKSALVTSPVFGCPLLVDRIIANSKSVEYSMLCQKLIETMGYERALDKIHNSFGASHINQFTISILDDLSSDYFSIIKREGFGFQFFWIDSLMHGLPKLFALHKKLQDLFLKYVPIFNCRYLGNTGVLLLLRSRHLED